MSKIPAINEIDANSPSQESTEVVVKATTVTPDINEIQETISASATIQEIDGTRKPTISEIYKIVNDGLFESTTNWWDYAYKLSQAQLNQDIISRLDNGVIGGSYSKGVDIITTTSNKVPSNTNVYSALKSDSLYPKKLNDEVINGIYDFLNGLTIGKPTAYTGGTWSVDQTGRTHLTTDYLYVRLKAIFETLQILNVDTIGGKLVISPAGSIKVAYVDRIRIDAPVFKHDENTDVWSISQIEDAEGNLVNETLNQEVYRCYFLGEQDGEEIDNKWKVGDQAQAKTFNVKKGTYHKVENSYLWRLVVNVSSDTVDIDGKKYHYVDLSQIDFDSGSDAPAPGDVLNQLGHRLNDTQRQTALVLNAVDNYAPSITLYAGVNYYTLLNKEYVEFGVYNGKAFFNVYGDMYIGDKGENPKTYIKYKNGKINIKANLEIGSSIGDKDLDQYIKENGGVDEETVNNLINNSQVIKDLQKQTDGAIETWFYEGVPTLDNLPAVDWNTSELKKIHIGDLYYDQITGYAYRFTKYNDDVNPYRWNRIKDNDIVSALDAANRAQITADGKMKVFYGDTKPTNYQVGDMWVNATLEGKFNNDIARAVADNKTSFNANDWVLASRYSEAIATIQKWTNEYETKFSNLVDEVKQQKDQSIVVWYYDYEPTVDNAPANTWNTDELRSEHIGDIFYDIKNNHSYRWTGTTWIQIKDADFNEAMKAAKAADDKAGAAGDLADSKRRIFYSDTTPTEPFDKGDLWIKRVGDKTETWVYNGTDWVKSDDKALNDFKNAINEELAGIKGQLDGKAETWYQVDDPSTDWTNKASHEGDIWYNTSNGTTNYWNGSAWEQMDIPKDVFDTIDGKSSIFVDSYVDAKAGTGVISKGYKERDLWILPEDATINSVKYYKGDMLTAVSKNTNFDETNWKKKVRYVGPTELNNAIDVVNEKINTINNITIPGINNKFNEFIEDGVLDSSEKARLTDLLNQASNEVAAVIDQVNNITTSKYLTNDNANKGKLEEANTVMKTAWTEYKNLINTLIAANTEITKVNIGEANTKYRNLQEKIKTVKQYLAICQADILSGMGTDITSYKYLKDALNQTTEINGGLVLTSAIQLKDVDKKVTAGMNGIVKGDKTSIAAWYGGPMVDRDTFTSEELETKVPGTDYAMSLLRHDGTGYLAGGNIHWNANGVLSGNFNSFMLQGTSMVTMFYYIRLFYLHTANQDSTDFNNIDYVTPMKTFSRLSVLSLGGVEGGNNLPTGLFIGDSNTGGSFQIGNIILRTKSGDPNILEIVSASSNKTAHLGVQGGVSAYGTYTPSTGGGGGLNATVVSYANILKGNYVDTDLTSIPNAYSVKALSNRIDNIATELDGLNLSWNNITDKPTTFTPSAHNHKWIDITDRITKVSQLTNDAGYLTTHQSLADYYTRAEIDAKGYTTNKGTVTSVGLTLPTGLTCAINTITTSGTFAVTFASGYSIPTTTKQSSWDSAVSVKHSHSNKTVLDGITSTKVTNWDSAYRWYSLITTDEETADGIINKWNEVVNFLANIAQTDTLSGIIDGINTSISNEVSRAKKAEGTNASNISANKTSITTLQGYFTSGSAKKALQLTTARNLWGNAFNGTADVNGSIVLPSDKYISIGNIKLEYDAINKALKITNTTTDEVANLYASGGVSAYGVGSVAGSGGGGLNGTIVPYSTAITSDPQNEGSKIASASSIYKLHSRISAIENNGATSITVTGTGNAITSVSKNGTSITFTKGATFLTSHQSLANYYTKGQVDNIANGKSSTSHTHSVKINGVTKTIAATGGTAVDLGTYLTSHQSLADYAKKSEIPTKVSQLTNDKNFVTGSVSGQTITINGVSTTWQNTWRGITDSYSGTSTGTSLSQKGANSLYNALHNGYASSAGNSDTVDGYHASGLLTALSNSDKGISITVGGTTKSISNISVNHASNADTATTSSMLKTSNWNGAMYVPSDTHYMCLGYMNCTGSYDCLTLLVTSAFWGNQHGSQDIITIQQSTNSNDTARIQTNVGRLRLGGSHERSFYYYKDDSRFRLYLYVYVIGGNSYGRWNISYLGGNATWITDHQENVTKSSSWIGIGYSAQVNYASSAGNADTASKVYGQVGDTGSHELVRCDMNNDQFRIIAGSSGDNKGWAEIATADDGNEPIYVRQYSGVFSSVVRTLTLLDAKGYTHFPSYINIGGNENNNSSPDRVWGSNGSDSYLRSYRTSALNVNYAASAGNADTVDGEHLIKNGSGTGIKQVYYFNAQGNNTSYIKLGTLKTVSATGYSTSKVMFTVKGGINFGGTNESVYEVAASTRGSIQVTSTLVRGNRELKFGYVSTSSNVEIWMAYDGTYRGATEVEVSSSVNFTLTMTETTTKPSGFVEGSYRILAATADNVASATKLQTPRTIWGQSFDGTNNIDGTLTITNSGSDDPHIISTVAKWFHIVSKYKLVLYAGDYNSSQRDAINILSNHNVGIGVDPSYKLHVAGDIYSSSTIRTAAQNKAIVLSNDSSPAWISALDGRVIFNTGKDIRFGETAWDWNEWAGLKYTHSNKTIYLGIADGSAFYANNPQSNGTLKFPGITTITPDSGARIGGSGGNLYLGNANDSGWVCTQSICSQTNSSLWSIRQDGNAYFKNIYSGAATIDGNLSVNGLISNKGILPTNYEVNDKGPDCYVSADALCSGITAITDSIQVNQVTVQYSNDNGNSWTNYSMSNDAKFNLYANNAGLNQVYLGYNVITGNNDAEKLAQVKKNELIVSFYISNNCYAQPYFASVDMSNGIYTICTVDILNNSGAVIETYTKRMTGWNQLNYINLSNGNTAQNVGNDSRRYIRFRFKHDQNTTALRNTVINKIRIFSFTKYSFPTDRFMGHTGHIYNFDYNMNTYFPNSILAKGGVTAYQSSDVRLKTNINKLNCLNVIKSIGGTYEFDYIRDHKHSIGFIAQNVNNPLLKDIVAKDDNGYLKINYWNPKLISLAFGALTEIDDEVDKLKARVRELESEVKYLKNKDYALQ